MSLWRSHLCSDHVLYSLGSGGFKYKHTRNYCFFFFFLSFFFSNCRDAYVCSGKGTDGNALILRLPSGNNNLVDKLSNDMSMMVYKLLDRCIIWYWCCIPVLLSLWKCNVPFLKKKVRSRFCWFDVMQRPDKCLWIIYFSSFYSVQLCHFGLPVTQGWYMLNFYVQLNAV